MPDMTEPPTPPDEPTQQLPAYLDPQPNRPGDAPPPPPQGESGKSRTPWIVGGIVVLAAAIAVVLVIVFTGGKPTDKTDATDNQSSSSSQASGSSGSSGATGSSGSSGSASSSSSAGSKSGFPFPSSASGSSAPKNPGEGDAPASAAQSFLDDLTKGDAGYPSAATQVCPKYRQVFLQGAKNGQYAKLEGKSPKTGKVSPKATDAVTVAYSYQGGSGSVPMIREGDTWQVCPADQNPGSVI